MNMRGSPSHSSIEHTHGLAVEVLAFSCVDGQLLVRVVCADLGSHTPDARALELARLERGDLGAICHSTSWRFEAGGGGRSRVVLTYAALPCDGRGRPVGIAPIMSSGSPTEPTPHGLHEHHVVAHALRHLSRLADADPGIAVAAAQPSVSDLWECIRAIAGAIEVVPCGPHPAHDRDDHVVTQELGTNSTPMLGSGS